MRDALIFLAGCLFGGLLVVSTVAIEAFLDWRKNR